MEAAAVALDLLGVECRLLARRALGSAPQLRHLERKATTGHQPVEQAVSGFSLQVSSVYSIVNNTIESE